MSIRIDLENLLVDGNSGIYKYSDYLNSYFTVFEAITWRALTVPVDKIYMLNTFSGSEGDCTLIDNFREYTSRKLTQFSKFFIITESERQEDINLKNLLEDRDYKISTFIKDLIDKYTETYMEKIKYILKTENTKIVISKYYNPQIIQVSRIILSKDHEDLKIT